MYSKFYILDIYLFKFKYKTDCELIKTTNKIL